MRNCVRHIPVLVLAGALVLGGPSISRAQAQDTSQVSADTSEYQGYGGGDTSAAATQSTNEADSSTGVYLAPPADTGGLPADTGLEAEPQVQIVPGAGDTGDVGNAGATGADALVCKDGSNAARTDGCVSNGGIDWAATEAATKAKPADTTETR